MPQREEKGVNKESAYTGLTNQGYRTGGRSKNATIERIQRLYQSRAPQREEKGNTKESGYGGCINQGRRRGRRRATIKRADTGRRATIKRKDTEAIQIKGTAKGGEVRQ